MASENSVPENNPTPDASDKPTQQSRESEPKITPRPSGSQLPPPHAHCQVTCKQEKNWWDKGKPFVEILGIALLAIYTGYTIKIFRANNKAAKIAQQTYDASERPYVGIEGVTYESFDKNGKMADHRNIYFKEATQLEVQSAIKNYGPVPGTNFDSDWALFIDDKHIEFSKLPEFGKTIFPSQEVGFNGAMARTLYQDLISRKIRASVEIRISYDGPSAHYGYCNLYQFLMPPGQFVDLGKCTHQW